MGSVLRAGLVVEKLEYVSAGFTIAVKDEMAGLHFSGRESGGGTRRVDGDPRFSFFKTAGANWPMAVK